MIWTNIGDHMHNNPQFEKKIEKKVPKKEFSKIKSQCCEIKYLSWKQ